MILLHRTLFRGFEEIKEKLEDADEVVESLTEKASDMLQGFMHIAAGKVKICGIEHQHGCNNKKEMDNSSEKGEENHDRNNDRNNKQHRMKGEVIKSLFH